jgi:hypothetical protein
VSLGALMCVVMPLSAMAEGEHVLLPYQCTPERGRVVLTASPERAYRLIGPRASHAFTACMPSNPNRCRTWQIHKFDFLCGTQRVPWLSVSAAILERSPQRGRVENGRLMLQLGPQWQRRDAVPTGFRHPFGAADRLLSFPVGFAPSLGSGVRFSGSSIPQPTVVDAKPDPRPEARTEARTETPRAEAKTAKAEPRLPPPSDKSFADKTSVSAIKDGWGATVTPAVVSAPLEASSSSLVWRGLAGVGIVLLAWGGLVAARRRAAIPPAADVPAGATVSSERTSQAQSGDDAALCAELVARAVNLHKAARDGVAALPNENLRNILTGDLATLQRRLLSAELTTAIADEDWTLVRPTVSKALVDLERIARIIAGVLSSQPAPKAEVTPVATAGAIPATRDEAFVVLGVNPEASRTVVKKVVDGLRQSWHPDHARDTADRARREERIKQINSAWDLIRAETTIDAERAA